MDNTTRDLEMMRSPQKWPNLVLPVKNREIRPEGGWPELGIMVEGHGASVFLCNMYAIDLSKEIEYASFEAAIEAGWRVD